MCRFQTIIHLYNIWSTFFFFFLQQSVYFFWPIHFVSSRDPAGVELSGIEMPINQNRLLAKDSLDFNIFHASQGKGLGKFTCQRQIINALLVLIIPWWLWPVLLQESGVQLILYLRASYTEWQHAALYPVWLCYCRLSACQGKTDADWQPTKGLCHGYCNHIQHGLRRTVFDALIVSRYQMHNEHIFSSWCSFDIVARAAPCRCLFSVSNLT